MRLRSNEASWLSFWERRRSVISRGRGFDVRRQSRSEENDCESELLSIILLSEQRRRSYVGHLIHWTRVSERRTTIRLFCFAVVLIVTISLSERILDDGWALSLSRLVFVVTVASRRMASSTNKSETDSTF